VVLWVVFLLRPFSLAVLAAFCFAAIAFSAMPGIMGRIFESYMPKKIRSLEDVRYWDNWARRKTEEYILNCRGGFAKRRAAKIRA